MTILQIGGFQILPQVCTRSAQRSSRVVASTTCIQGPTGHIDSRPALRRSEAMRRIQDGDLVRRSSPAAKHRAYRGHHRRAVCAVFIVDLLDDLQCQVPERLLVLHAP